MSNPSSVSQSTTQKRGELARDLAFLLSRYWLARHPNPVLATDANGPEKKSRRSRNMKKGVTERAWHNMPHVPDTEVAAGEPPSRRCVSLGNPNGRLSSAFAGHACDA